MRAKHEVCISYGSKFIAKVKVDNRQQIDRQTDRTKTIYMPPIIRSGGITRFPGRSSSASRCNIHKSQTTNTPKLQLLDYTIKFLCDILWESEYNKRYPMEIKLHNQTPMGIKLYNLTPMVYPIGIKLQIKLLWDILWESNYTIKLLCDIQWESNYTIKLLWDILWESNYTIKLLWDILWESNYTIKLLCDIL